LRSPLNKIYVTLLASFHRAHTHVNCFNAQGCGHLSAEVYPPAAGQIYPPEADFECVETKVASQFVFAIIHSELQNATTFIRKNIGFEKFYQLPFYNSSVFLKKFSPPSRRFLSSVPRPPQF